MFSIELFVPFHKLFSVIIDSVLILPADALKPEMSLFGSFLQAIKTIKNERIRMVFFISNRFFKENIASINMPFTVFEQ
jgi:hypothetical protein